MCPTESECRRFLEASGWEVDAAFAKLRGRARVQDSELDRIFKKGMVWKCFSARASSHTCIEIEPLIS